MSEPHDEDEEIAGWEAPWDEIGQRGWQPSEMRQPRPPARPAEPDPSPPEEPPADPAG